MIDSSQQNALESQGFLVIKALLSEEACSQVRECYDQDQLFRNTVDMARYRFGQGQYRYFSYPLPRQVVELRESFYPKLVPVANRWWELLKEGKSFPSSYRDFLADCKEQGQERPTPLLLRYGAGDYNCLHQDLYGPCVFPLQLVCLLSQPGEDFEGGELVLTEQRPRAQSRAHVVPLRKGDAAIIATHHFPRAGSKGPYRAALRHGVSEIRRGQRFTLGIIFHDAA
ncbi:MAG TPA: 2OG-Fe(II) oxygenase [Steroidobacteraceae bacterium]|jgi:hypothetical protein